MDKVRKVFDSVADNYDIMNDIMSFGIHRLWKDKMHDNFQVIKSLEAFKKGKLIGVGPGEGNVKMLLPDCHTDFIFSVLAEEFGLIMCLTTLMLFGIISARLLYIAYREINIGVTLSVLPTTGITLPLLSYGGSSLLSSSIALGIMLSFSRSQSITLKFQERIAMR
ncbi:UbiE/COQ5 methyltransferase, conserved site,Probable peptidoglycan glycosyltransferase [Cinara cedri]|uniref:peptidoglycan glycosyltransferase n=1 Tax=Cinara cedri TaxID=506608 RepID=A0A5E4MWC1_9HEMI|nr:UbiE/COQ5 methyltransferase, conserved site,Probable peptidoglycan glycosyltransferase [Cinara cedri]